jgi:DNA-binding MarR family transcriptional regulator
MHRLIAGHASDISEVGVTMAQAKVLYVVMAADRLRMSELAARLGIGLSSASGIVDRLVELSMLRREDDPNDRRQVVVSATRQAQELIERFRELNQRQLRELLGRLDADELAVIGQSLDIFDRAIDRAGPDTTSQPTTDREKPS